MTVRITGGRFRGQRLRVPAGLRVRPTSSRVREALFNILGDITGHRILDLFCGAGTLGLEALSRGAESALFVDASRASLQCVQENLTRLGLSAPLLKQRLPEGIRRIRGEFDLVFCDPPYAENPLEALAQPLLDWPSVDTRGYGGTSLTFLRRNKSTADS